MGLRWCDIDLERRAIYVTRSLHQLHTGEYVIRPPKTPAGKRVVKLTDEPVEVLRKHRANREAQAVLLGIALDEQGLVFANTDGSHIRPDYVTKVWAQFAKQCGLQGVRFHDARHLHATLLLKQGIHPKIVQMRLGHGSIKVTMDTYSHAMESMQDAAMENFDALIFTEDAGRGT
jgi:integrase